MGKEIPLGAVVCKHSSETWMKVIIGVGASVVLPLFLLYSRDASKPLNLYALAGLVLLLVVVQACAIIWVSKRVIVSGMGLLQRTLLRERHVPFDQVLFAERRTDTDGEEVLAIHCVKGRMRCTVAMDNYQAFVGRLAAHVPVRWHNADLLAFPVMISLRRQTMNDAVSTIVAFVLACACAFGCYHFWVAGDKPEWPMVTVLGGLTLFFIAGGVISQTDFFKRPRGYVFWPDYFDVKLPQLTGRIHAAAVQDVATRRETYRDAVICKLRIQFNDVIVEIDSTQTSVPLEPLCALLRDAYYSEAKKAALEQSSVGMPVTERKGGM